MTKALKQQLKIGLEAIVNSYSILFFLNNRWMAVAIIAASFLNFYAGLSGLIAVTFTVIVALLMKFDNDQLKRGIYSFNALITGIGLGTFFEPGGVFIALLILTSLLSLILSVAMSGWLFKHGLPFLSMPFVFTFWVVILPYAEYANLGLTQRNIFWINELYSLGGTSLVNFYQQIESIELGHAVETYLRSLSSVFFQDNLLAGILVATGLIIASRIFFTLSVIGFVTAYLFASFVGSEAASITYYNIGANFIMVAIAAGGFFTIPSRSSFFWTIILVPITSVILLFFTRLLAFVNLPVFSLPYTIVTILFVHFLRHRSMVGTPTLTPLQQYSPEANLYSFQNNNERLARFWYMPFQLPFWGSWTVTQGYDGAFTHKDEWGKALDFMIQDQEGKAFQGSGSINEQYYCFGKPVTAPADGVVTNCIDGIDDNATGNVNTLQNWGNSIVIQHSSGVFSQLSHLKKNSVKVKKGEFVKAGEIIAQCGNSGRSPYPHLHFQIQTQPVIGARTLEYPIAYFQSYATKTSPALKQFTVPALSETVSNLQPDNLLYNAFNILPDTGLVFEYSDKHGNKKIEHWDAYTDAYNYNYLFSRETGAVAYYTCDKIMFYFTTFYGNKKSLLYEFYISAYKILLADADMKLEDKLPANMLSASGILMSINDLIAPFTSLINSVYDQRERKSGNGTAELLTSARVSFAGKTISDRHHSIIVGMSGIENFSVQSQKQTIHAIRIQ